MFLWLGLGLAIVQGLVGWQLVVIHREFRKASEERQALEAQDKLMIDQNERIIGRQTGFLETQEKLTRWLDRLEKEQHKGGQ